MGSFTDYLEDELLDHIFNAAFTSPAAIFLALATGDPGDGATGAAMSEVPNAGSYARTAISFGLAAARAVTQDALLTFPTATGGGWGTVSHWAIVDNGTHGAGNVLCYGAFAASKTVNAGDTPSVASGQIVVSFTAGEISDFLALELLDHCFNNAAFATTAGNTFLALCTAVVGDGDTGSTITEPVGGSYARKEVNENGGASPTWDVSASSLVDNTHAISFVTATGSWGTAVAIAICDAATLGNLLLYDNGMTDKAIGIGDTAQFPVGDLDITMS